MSSDHLFCGRDMYQVTQSQTAAAKKAVQIIAPNALLNTSEHDLIAGIVEQFTMHVPKLLATEMYVAESGETQVDVRHDPMRAVFDRSRPCLVPGNRTVIAIPFEGDAGFFHIQPQTYSMNRPRAIINKNEIQLTYVRTDHDGEAIKREYQQAVKSINEYLGWLESSAKQFNEQLPGIIGTEVRTRKDRLLKDAGMTAAIGLPLKKREGVPATYSVPVKRRTPRIEQSATMAAFRPEPALALEEYEEILRIISNMVHVMERSPRAFHQLGEEDLRTHFLVHLNGAYEGQATGETFNFQGKTDILIRAEGKNVFIAECKVWRGEQEFQQAIDQLLSYLNWRDTKAAILVFNRNANFTAVLEKLRESAPTHACYKRTIGPQGETGMRYIFHQPDDQNREVILTVLAFDNPDQPVKGASTRLGRHLFCSKV